MAKRRSLTAASAQTAQPQDNFLHALLARWLGVLSLAVTLAFFLQTRDSAQIKITLFYIGAAGFFALWLSALYLRGQNIFNKKNLTLLLPFLCLFIYVLLSYFISPNFFGRFEGFSYFIFYAALFAAVSFEAREDFLSTLVSFILCAAWAAFLYGVLQIINNCLLPGADPLFWTDFFGKRIFSTSANPNFYADFCLAALMLAAARFLYNKDKKMLALIALGLVNIFFTESKAAWLALGAGAVLFAAVYLAFFAALARKTKIKTAVFVIAIALFLGALAGVFSAKRIRSVNFRLYTWAT
ncbi:MAG: hypothetical protein LBR90_03955, partial [Elusimicrobiota bacterium]|nr:hypothetical protein [Elusimicrobiota bacterium]